MSEREERLEGVVKNLAKYIEALETELREASDELYLIRGPKVDEQAARQHEKELREAEQWLTENRGLVVGQNPDGIGMRVPEET